MPLDRLAPPAPEMSLGSGGADGSRSSDDRTGVATDQASASWPEIIPFGSESLSEIDVSSWPGWLGDFVRASSEATQTPAELPAAMALAAVSVAVARHWDVEARPGWVEPLNLWTCCTLGPANRKSAVVEAATRPLVAWERAQAEAMAPAIKAAKLKAEIATARAKKAKSKAANAETDKDFKVFSAEAAAAEKAIPPIPIAPRLRTSDATPEALGKLLAENGERFGWLSSEGGFFDIFGGRYSQGSLNLDLLLKLHVGDPDVVDRIGRDTVSLERPLLTVGFSPQPGVIEGLSASGAAFRDRGVLARFLWFKPKSWLGYRAISPPPVPPDVANDYAGGLAALLDVPQGGGGRLRFGDAAQAEIGAFEAAIEAGMRPGGKHDGLHDVAGKAVGAAVRVAGVLHVAEHGRGATGVPIGVEAADAAIDLVIVALEHARAVFGLMRADPAAAMAQRLMAWLKRRQVTSFSIREAFQQLKSSATRKVQVEAAAAVLAERGFIRLQAAGVREGAGRPESARYAVNPAALRDFP
jgi:hypothetical protein